MLSENSDPRNHLKNIPKYCVPIQYRYIQKKLKHTRKKFTISKIYIDISIIEKLILNLNLLLSNS